MNKRGNKGGKERKRQWEDERTRGWAERERGEWGRCLLMSISGALMERYKRRTLTRGSRGDREKKRKQESRHERRHPRQWNGIRRASRGSKRIETKRWDREGENTFLVSHFSIVAPLMISSLIIHTPYTTCSSSVVRRNTKWFSGCSSWLEMKRILSSWSSENVLRGTLLGVMPCGKQNPAILGIETLELIKNSYSMKQSGNKRCRRKTEKSREIRRLMTT